MKAEARQGTEPKPPRLQKNQPEVIIFRLLPAYPPDQTDSTRPVLLVPMVITPKHAKYYALRTASREAVAESFLVKIRRSQHASSWNGVVFGSIDKGATDCARLEWPKHYSDQTHRGFSESWETLHRKFLPIPSFFDLAIWQRIEGQLVLQGMALGKPSDGKTHLTLNWVERSFAPDYLRGGVLLPILACAEEYAKLLGCQRVLIKNPVDPAKYERYGYSPYALRRVRATYLCKEL
ncbi:hypothetical protein J2X36_004191 [Methylobacterium sp. BE186]|uniref:hypothetical protein n=1 Tax=Methylobacterium sp. BE186 TaxID=2817715 RepID=UPI00285E4B1B|nr:hypothetical protein [Methylobacterium sp. BE186]MDR7039415.1 hypothetical protein [Methylobacterium sp. BE186]